MTLASTALVEKVSGALASRFNRRGFFLRSALVGTAFAVDPVKYSLTPTDAYSVACQCSGYNCGCDSMCCSGYTEFCCTISGSNHCPPGALLGGWWKVDGTGFCNGPRYYMDCNAPCNGCGCGGNGVCSGACSGTSCGCALGDCNNRKAGCVNFRYGQCNQQVACIGPIICRIVTCIAPWEIDGTCTTTPRYDPATAYHDRPCLHTVRGDVNSAEETTLNGSGAIRITGWAIDEDTNAPIDVHVYVDGQGPTVQRADKYRPDVASTFPGMGAAHGFDITVNAGPGQHQICAYGINVGPNGNGNAVLGCRDVRIGTPIGAVTGYRTAPGSVTVLGWAVDPDTPNAPIDVHAYVDGQGPTISKAQAPRPDVSALGPYGPNHGFEITIPVSSGNHNVCVYAINVPSGGANPQLGCIDVVVGSPVGSLDAVHPRPGGFTASGWALDTDAPKETLQVQVRVDGATALTTSADQAREDVAELFPAAGPNHGFESFVAAQPGVRQVELFALNRGGGKDVVLGARSVEVRAGDPFGELESAVAAPKAVRVTGWIIDPDDSAANQVRVLIDGQVAIEGVADVERLDIAAKYPGYGGAHGFDLLAPADHGLLTVDVVAVNVGAGQDAVVGTKQVLVGADPYGSIDRIAVEGSAVRVVGWAVDPDSPDPIDVRIKVGGTVVATVLADVERDDLEALFGDFGIAHGFDVRLPTSAVTGELCVEAVGSGAGAESAVLGCRTVATP